MGISRRSVIIGSAALGVGGGLGLWALLADARLVPGRTVVDAVLGRCDVEATPPEAEPGRILRASFYSNRRKRTVRYQLIYPPNVPAGVRLPVCVYLHGYGADEKEAESLGFHRLLAGAVEAGVPPFVLATVDGGERFWHPRADGDDPLGMVVEDFPVVLAQYGLPTEKMALLGLAMGGYGALLAACTAPTRFVGVAASSPALWHSYDDSVDAELNAFDSPEDFRAHGDLRAKLAALKGLAVRVDCGEADTYAGALRTLREQFPDRGSVFFAPRGCHDSVFWRAAAPEQLRLIGTTLTPPPPA